MGGNLTEGLLILAALYPFSGFRADAFVHPHAIFGTSSWTNNQERQQQSCCRDTCGGVETRSRGSSSSRRPRQRRELSHGKGLRMQADTTGTETEISDVVPPALSQFDNRER